MQLSYDQHLTRIAADRHRAMIIGTWQLVGFGCALIALLIVTGVL